MNEKIHQVEIIEIDSHQLTIKVDGRFYRLAWGACSPKLAAASMIERTYIDISPSGYGLHWPLLDEDLAIDPLLNEVAELIPEAI